MNVCFLCLEDANGADEGLGSEKWREQNINELINMHLWPLVVEDTHRSSWVCNNCGRVLFNFHEYYERVKVVQNNYRKQIKCLLEAPAAESETILENENNEYLEDNCKDVTINTSGIKDSHLEELLPTEFIMDGPNINSEKEDNLNIVDVEIKHVRKRGRPPKNKSKNTTQNREDPLLGVKITNGRSKRCHKELPISTDDQNLISKSPNEFLSSEETSYSPSLLDIADTNDSDTESRNEKDKNKTENTTENREDPLLEVKITNRKSKRCHKELPISTDDQNLISKSPNELLSSEETSYSPSLLDIADTNDSDTESRNEKDKNKTENTTENREDPLLGVKITNRKSKRCHKELPISTDDQNLISKSPNELLSSEETNYSPSLLGIKDTDDSETATESQDEKDIRAETTKKKNHHNLDEKVQKEYDKIIAENFKIFCNVCQIEIDDFSSLQRHFRSEHKSQGYARCCNRNFTTRTALVDHIQGHLNPEFFKCQQCGKVLSDRSTLSYHQKLHDSELHKCDTCGKAYTDKRSLKNHMQVHSSEKLLPCAICGKHFANSSYMKTHIKLVHENKFVQICDICGKSIRCPRAFACHMENHKVKTTPISCDICGFLLTSRQGLNRHKNAQHPKGGRKEHKCHICSKLSPTVGSLKAHIRNVHQKGFDFKCSLCPKQLKTASALKEHMSKHTGKALYTCPWCPLTFHTNGKMYNHRKYVHPTEWEELQRQKYADNNSKFQHVCDICGKLFADERTLKHHAQTHTSEKFSCPICGKCFTNALYKKSHIEIVHEKKFVQTCDICGKSIRWPLAFARHMENHKGNRTPAISCDACGMLFNTKQGLNLHKESKHPEGEKQQHPCHICSKVSSTLTKLKYHIRNVHETGFDFKCSLCEKSFKRASSLKEHTAGHSGTALFKCTWCPRTFMTNGNMYHHRKNAHPKEYEELKRQKYAPIVQ